MKIESAASPMITGARAQESAFSSGDIRAQLLVARSTEDLEVQKLILKSDNPRILVALASNTHLHPEIEQALAKSKLPGVLSALIDRRA